MHFLDSLNLIYDLILFSHLVYNLELLYKTKLYLILTNDLT